MSSREIVLRSAQNIPRPTIGGWRSGWASVPALAGVVNLFVSPRLPFGVVVFHVWVVARHRF